MGVGCRFLFTRSWPSPTHKNKQKSGCQRNKSIRGTTTKQTLRIRRDLQSVSPSLGFSVSTIMTSFEEHLSASIASGTLPGAVFLAADKSGKFSHYDCQTRNLGALSLVLLFSSPTSKKEAYAGNFRYSHAVGLLSSNPDRTPSAPLTPDTVLTIASCTKLFTAIAALQCVEQGLLTLDGDVAVPGLLPELADLDILEGWDEEKDQPITRARTKPITPR